MVGNVEKRAFGRVVGQSRPLHRDGDTVGKDKNENRVVEPFGSSEFSACFSKRVPRREQEQRVALAVVDPGRRAATETVSAHHQCLQNTVRLTGLIISYPNKDTFTTCTGDNAQKKDD